MGEKLALDPWEVVSEFLGSRDISRRTRAWIQGHGGALGRQERGTANESLTRPAAICRGGSASACWLASAGAAYV
jgi:hypothetical protein